MNSFHAPGDLPTDPRTSVANRQLQFKGGSQERNARRTRPREPPSKAVAVSAWPLRGMNSFPAPRDLPPRIRAHPWQSRFSSLLLLFALRREEEEHACHGSPRIRGGEFDSRGADSRPAACSRIRQLQFKGGSQESIARRSRPREPPRKAVAVSAWPLRGMNSFPAPRDLPPRIRAHPWQSRFSSLLLLFALRREEEEHACHGSTRIRGGEFDSRGADSRPAACSRIRQLQFKGGSQESIARRSRPREPPRKAVAVSAWPLR